MQSDIAVYFGIGGIIVSALAGIVLNHQNKKKEIELKTREEKLTRYDELISSLTMYYMNASEESTKNFIHAYNRATGYASAGVLEACNKLLRSTVKQSMKRRGEELDSDKHINNIFNAIRQDINPKEPTFNFKVYDQ